MIKIRAKDLINSEEFVREPVDNEVNKILESNSKRIIISGPKGTGKSTVLCSLEQRGLGSREQTINICPDAVVTLKKEPEGRFSSKEFESFHELQFTNYILRYIKNNYPIMFNKCFYKEERQTNELTHSYFDKLNSCIFGDFKFDTELSSKELSYNILKDLRKLLKLEKLNLSIDRFDSINGSSKYSQEIYQRYFDMFDKTIIVADDHNIDKDRLSKSEFEIKQISYGKDIEVLREIIRRRIREYNMENEKKMHEEFFTSDYFIERLVNEEGDISFSIETLYNIDKLIKWYGSVNRMSGILDEAIEEQRDTEKKLEKILPKPTLYL